MLSIYHITRDFKKTRKNNKVTKNFLQGDSNPDPQNQLELKVDASIHKTTSVNADNSSLKEVYQRAKKVVSDSPGLVDFAIGLVNSVFNLPDGQVMFFEEFE